DYYCAIWHSSAWIF
nr:immunoglobulin light chain junction region [Macaca mulatta]MOW01431.1 immunoglobulin light chain junction region [Macaca mulatta]MOW27249.1 immunoglobulin light chain junction region [Macaca mulatta]MOW27271.1 immunoglobulin light chain junction region [Macaca mulatta]MOW27298.1 immunoglobulin light chain junction region [Macaca mulatta]